MANLWIRLYLFFRVLRWSAWIVFFGWSFFYSLDKQPFLNSFNQLKLGASMMFFIPGIIAMFAGCLELMMRDRAGLARPKLGEIIPPRATSALGDIR